MYNKRTPAPLMHTGSCTTEKFVIEDGKCVCMCVWVIAKFKSVKMTVSGSNVLEAQDLASTLRYYDCRRTSSTAVGTIVGEVS